MSFWKTPRYNLTESEIWYAMKNSENNRSAADFLHVSGTVYAKYAKMYIDAETGKSLYELHRRRKKHKARQSSHAAPIEDLLAGKYPKTACSTVRRRVIAEGIMLDQCSICGHDERRLSDNASATILTYLNGNRSDHRRENITFTCPNCYFLYYGDIRPWGGYYKIKPDAYEPYDPRREDLDNEIDFSQY